MSEERCKRCGNGVPTNGDQWCCQKPDECPYDMAAMAPTTEIFEPPSGVSWSPTHYIKTASDRSLIDELKSRGYRVPKRDRVRTVSCGETITRNGLTESALKRAGYMQSLYERLGARLGVYLMKNGALPVRHEVGIGKDIFITSLTIVVEDPEFDRPFPLELHHG